MGGLRERGALVNAVLSVVGLIIGIPLALFLRFVLPRAIVRTIRAEWRYRRHGI